MKLTVKRHPESGHAFTVQPIRSPGQGPPLRHRVPHHRTTPVLASCWPVRPPRTIGHSGQKTARFGGMNEASRVLRILEHSCSDQGSCKDASLELSYATAAELLAVLRHSRCTEVMVTLVGMPQVTPIATPDVLSDKTLQLSVRCAVLRNLEVSSSVCLELLVGDVEPELAIEALWRFCHERDSHELATLPVNEAVLPLLEAFNSTDAERPALCAAIASSSRYARARQLALEVLQPGDAPLDVLSRVATSDTDEHVRAAAVLRMIPDAESTSLLARLAVTDASQMVRLFALDALAERLGPDAPLHSRLEGVYKPEARSAIVDHLANKVSFEEVAAVAVSDPDSSVRAAALGTALAKRQDKELLVRVFHEDSDPANRCFALSVIGSDLRDNRFVENVLRHDQDVSVRSRAVDILKTHQDSLPVVLNAARTDPDASIRERAVVVADVLSAPLDDLIDLARSDETPAVRLAAVKALRERDGSSRALVQIAIRDRDDVVCVAAVKNLDVSDLRTVVRRALSGPARDAAEERLEEIARLQLAQRVNKRASAPGEDRWPSVGFWLLVLLLVIVTSRCSNEGSIISCRNPNAPVSKGC